MRLRFSSSHDHLNTDISDEQGNVLYNVSTPSGFLTKKVTTIRKFNQGGASGETMGIIEWARGFGMESFRFNGRVIPADEMFQKRMWNSGLYFVGPDRRTYKWKLSSHCWMKYAESNVELVRFHQKNLGILKPIHPSYLDVSPSVASMLDHIIITFIYVESLRRLRRSRRSQHVQSSNVNVINMNVINMNSAMAGGLTC